MDAVLSSKKPSDAKAGEAGDLESTSSSATPSSSSEDTKPAKQNDCKLFVTVKTIDDEMVVVSP